MNRSFWPEGRRIDTPENRQYTASFAGLSEAAVSGTVLEARAVLCDRDHNLHVEMPCMEGLIPYAEGAVGLAEGQTRDIALITRVSKPVCFTVTGFETTAEGVRRAVCSRRAAQERCRREYIGALRPGDVVEARVTRLESFGAFCDVGCGLPALLPIASISVSRISHPADRLTAGQDILAVVTSVEDGRVCLSQRELYGTWEQNAARFSAGETVAGIVRSVEPYGVFVELTPNLAGLAEPFEGAAVGQCASVYIKSILPDRMKLKLVIVDARFDDLPVRPPYYYITEGHLSRWEYAPAGCAKSIGTVFDRET